MKFFPIREHMLLGGLIIVYRVETLSGILLFICHSTVSFPMFLSASWVCPAQVGFYILSFSQYGKTQVKRNFSQNLTCLNCSVVVLFEGGAMREMAEDSQKTMDLNLIIIRLRAKYFGNFHEEICLGIFWINIILKFWQHAEFRPPTLYGA